MLPAADRVGTQLERDIDGRAVYAMRGPGSSLLDYAERIRYAAEQLEVRDFLVVLERSDIKLAYCSSGNVHGPCLMRASGGLATDVRPPAASAQRYLRHSALLQYLLGHLRFDPVQRLRGALAALSPAPVKSAQPSKPYDAAELDFVMETFFARITPYRSGRLVMVFDCDRAALNRGESGSDSDSYVNALAGTINGLYKAELIHRRAPWKSQATVELATLEWAA